MAEKQKATGDYSVTVDRSGTFSHNSTCLHSYKYESPTGLVMLIKSTGGGI